MGRKCMYRRPWQGSWWPWKGCPSGFVQATCLDLSLMKDSAAAVQSEWRDKTLAMLERVAHGGYSPPSGHDRACKGMILTTLEVWWHADMTTETCTSTVFFSVCLQNWNKEQQLKRQRKGTHIDLGTIEAILVNHTVKKKTKIKTSKQKASA